MRARSHRRSARAAGLFRAGLLLSLMALRVPPASAQDAMSNPELVLLLTNAFNTAMTAFQNGDYQKAAANLETVVSKADPTAKLEPVYFTLGVSYFNLEQYDKAAQTLKTYQEKYPKGERMADAVLCIGEASYLSKDYDEAVAQLSRLENAPALREQALQYEAAAYKDGGKADKAIQTLEKLVSPEIKSTIGVNGAMTLASLYAENKQPEKANALIRKVLQKIDLVDNMVHLNAMVVDLGDNLLNEQHPAEAIEAYRYVRSREEVIDFQGKRVVSSQQRMEANLAAMRANPAESSQYVAIHRRLSEDVLKARQLLAEAEKLPDFSPVVLLRQGKAWYESDGKWEAILAFNRLLKKYPQAKEREPALFAMLTSYAEVNQPERVRQLCEQYLRDFPKERNADTVGYLLGATALQANEPKAAESYFGKMLQERPDSALKDEMRFLLANAKFAQGKFDEAIQDYKHYQQDFPQGQRIEESVYRIGMALVFAGNFEAAPAALDEYVRKYPQGAFVADARYRLAVCKYAAQKYDEVLADVDAWQQAFPHDELKGEVLALQADTLAAQGKTAQAISTYVDSYKCATGDEVLNYSLFEASKQMQKLGKWDDVSKLFQDFLKEKPDHPSAVAAMYWIGKAMTHEGKVDEAKQYLVGQIKRYVGDPGREAVEQLLQQLAQLCLKRPRPTPAAVAVATPTPTPAPVTLAAGSPVPVATPPPPPPYDPVAALDDQLKPLEGETNATAQARFLYARAELATLRRKPDEHDALIGQIAKTKPGDLSPLLLAQAGDYLLAKGESERATTCYNQLKDYYPKSNYLDYAYVGLGEIAFARKDYDAALGLFTEAADKIAQSKIKEATIGKAKTSLQLAKYEEAKQLFEQVASVREWRGESTAYAVYSLGEIESRQGHWPEAIARYQRVFVLYQKYLPWVARAYLGSAEGFEKLGKRPEAVNHLKEMLRNEKLQKLPEFEQAKQMLQQWGASA